ncbi:MAG TPA: asparagine synthetase B, partial [Micromonosporaceae bacterium]|nr:asparagine synthetase B [Micromonosporaceae bacterium]
MCGLLTFVSANRAAGDHREKIAEALENLHHRGPDETGVVDLGDDVVLAFKRLAIIDVENSHQPMHYADGRYTMTFNGEIYNYLELREELVREHGASFQTDGDSEVILAAYHHWGAAAVKRLRGMFAFVIWDGAERKAFGARDPFGIKPLYHLVTEDGAYFASEKKALLAIAPDLPVDTAGLSHYLTLQYVPETDSLHRGISRVECGHSFEYRPGGAVTQTRYYRADFRPAPTESPESLYQRIQDALRDSVRIHMRSDVPVGAFL